jgi:hypothetical protein
MSIEAMKQALEALEAHADIGIKSDKAITALRQAIEQAEKQEPVAWRFQSAVGGWAYGKEPPIGSKYAVEPLYTAPVHASDMSEKHVHESDKDRHIAMRKTTRDEKIVNPGVYEVPEFECPRCGHCCQQKKWVGFTHEELAWLNEALNLGGRFAVIEAIEAKLKEKNCG